MTVDFEQLPGADLIREGLDQLERKIESVPALLVAIGAPRLRRMGLPVPPDTALPDTPELRLSRLLARESREGVHSRFNALIRRLVSFESCLEFQHFRRLRRRSGRGDVLNT